MAVARRIKERRAIMATVTGTSSVCFFNFHISGESSSSRVMLINLGSQNICSDNPTSVAAMGDSDATIKWKPKL